MELELLERIKELSNEVDKLIDINILKHDSAEAFEVLTNMQMTLLEIKCDIKRTLPTPDTMIVNATPNGVKGFNPYME